MVRYSFDYCILTCSLGIDSIAAAYLFLRDFRRVIECKRFLLVVQLTPLSYSLMPYYANLLVKRLSSRFNVEIELVFTRPLRIELTANEVLQHKCRLYWKLAPFSRLVEELKCSPSRCLVVTGVSRLDESGIRRGLSHIIWPTRDYMKLAPCLNVKKRLRWKIARSIMNELEPIWSEIYLRYGHTSPDCMKCLHAELMKALKKAKGQG